MAQPERVYVGFLSYGQSTAKYLPDFLASLSKQTYPESQIINGDNTPIGQDNPNLAILANFPKIRCLANGANLGFAKGYNRLIALASQEQARYFLVINPDTVLLPETIERLVAYLDANPRVAAAVPKILRWDFIQRQATKQIDSLGVGLTKAGCFVDVGQGQDDQTGNDPGLIFGFTGAAVLLRLSALAEVAFNNGQSLEYFDELMFMYKEDCDLSYRLRLANWQIALVPEAIVYHDRTAVQCGHHELSQLYHRLSRPSSPIDRWSYANQLIIFCKYWSLPKTVLSRSRELFYQFKRLLAAMVFEPSTLPGLFSVVRRWSQIRQRQQALVIKIDPLAIEQWRR